MNTTSDLGQWPLFDDATGSADTAPAERSARTGMRRALREARPRVSIVMPCLNEAECIGYSLQDANAALEHLGIRGEIVVVDNGSSDGSGEIARSQGARVIVESRRGYGSAYRTGLNAALGQYLLLSDADGTYDLRSLRAFLEALERGADLVIGTRLKGQIDAGAMPWLHNRVGNPAISYLVNRAFGLDVSDVYCGLRAVTRQAYAALDLRTGGMEFALEMVIEAAHHGLMIEETPVHYRRRKGGASKLRRWKDGGRTLSFVMSRALAHHTLSSG